MRGHSGDDELFGRDNVSGNDRLDGDGHIDGDRCFRDPGDVMLACNP
jgi:hypothetical protein